MMSYTFEQRLLSKSKYALKAPFSMQPEGICVHNTAMDAPADNEIKYHNDNNNQVSYHVAIDDKKVIQCIPFDRSAYHAGDGAKGDGNRKHIGIEICYSKSGGPRYTAAEENTVQYIAKLLHERNWDVKRVKKHQDFSGKYCPHRILAEERWDSFTKRIQVALDKLEKGNDDMVFSSTTLESKVNTLLADKQAQKDLIEKGIAAKAFNTSWRDKFNKGELEKHDIVGLSVLYASVK